MSFCLYFRFIVILIKPEIIKFIKIIYQFNMFL